MKKIATIVMLFAIVLSLLSGCFKIPKNLVAAASSPKTSSGSGAASQKSASPDAQATKNAGGGQSTAAVSLKPATNPSEGYSNYLTVKGQATDRVSAASEKSDALSMAASMSLLGVSMADLSLITLTMFSADIKSSQLALSMLGM